MEVARATLAPPHAPPARTRFPGDFQPAEIEGHGDWHRVHGTLSLNQLCLLLVTLVAAHRCRKESRQGRMYSVRAGPAGAFRWFSRTLSGPPPDRRQVPPHLVTCQLIQGRERPWISRAQPCGCRAWRAFAGWPGPRRGHGARRPPTCTGRTDQTGLYHRELPRPGSAAESLIGRHPQPGSLARIRGSPGGLADHLAAARDGHARRAHA
jgi:hypothetical protein